MACRACGAASEGFVCLFCGTSLTVATSPADEAQALEELHQAILRAETDEARARILGNGLLPDHPAELVDAGLRAAALLDPKQYATPIPTAAIARIEALRAKLRLLGEDAADRELGASVARYEAGAASESKEGARVVAMLFLVLLAGIVVVILALRR
ncbi:MAG: hypothetical protein JNL79_31675 [Myxococcales bacterium]|nr:hypothetical protein [Myxococcales bacterium]